MKKKIIITACFILVVILCILLKINTSPISYLEYDILVENHQQEVYSSLPIDKKSINTLEDLTPYSPTGGYANIYYYTVINSEKKEKYTITYQDVYAERNKDTVNITISAVSDYEIQESVKNHGLSNKKIKLKSLLDRASSDRYEITEIVNLYQ